MKIAHINLFDQYGGAAKIANDIIQASRQGGHEVTLFAHRAIGKDEHVIPIPFLEKAHFTNLIERQRLQGLMNYYSNAVIRVLSHPSYQEADLVHLHCIYSGYFSYLLLPLLGVKPMVWTFHDTSIFTAHCLYPHRCSKWQDDISCVDCPMDVNIPANIRPQRSKLQQMKKAIFELTKCTIVVPSMWMETMVKQSFLSKQTIQLIYNGIDTTIFKPQKNKKALRKKFNIPLAKKVIMFAAHGGLNSEMKGGKYLVQALEQLQEKYPNWVLLNIGTTDNEILNNIKLQTINLPYLNDSSLLADYYSASDVFVSPSLTESFGLTICEALASGIPVVAFASGGVPELVQHKINGWLTDIGNVDGLVDGLKYVLNNKIREDYCNTNEMNSFRQKFSAVNMTTEYLSLYTKMLSAR